MTPWTLSAPLTPGYSLAVTDEISNSLPNGLRVAFSGAPPAAPPPLPCVTVTVGRALPVPEDVLGLNDGGPHCPVTLEKSVDLVISCGLEPQRLYCAR